MSVSARPWLTSLGVAPRPDGSLAVDPDTAQLGQRNLFFAGDVTGDRPLLHEASDEGRIAGANAATFPVVTPHPRRTPLAVVFSDPQMAIVGAPGRFHGCPEHRVGQVRYDNQGRARVMAENRGLVRIYGDVREGRIRGAEMFGPAVEHTAHLLAWAVQAGLSVEDALEMPFYHPTVEEGIRTGLRDLRDQLRRARPDRA